MTAAPRIGMVLSRAAPAGVRHTGFLQALADLGIEIAAAAGCSAGAVVGGVAASGAGLDAWSATLAHLDSRRFWTPDPWPRCCGGWRCAEARLHRPVGTEAAVEFCRSQLAAQRFEECRYPFHILAVSLGKGGKVLFSTGELAPRMMASAAMPMLYRPVEIDGDWYCDGALVDLAPMDAICCRHGLDALIIHHVAARYMGTGELARLRELPWAFLEILGRLLFWRRPWYLTGERLAFHRCPCGCGAVVIVLEPELPELPWPMTEGGPRVQAAARRQTEALLRPHLAALLGNPRERLPVPPALPAGASAAPDVACEDE